MTRDRFGESLRRYREASAALDERPSDATRAAILAAAARNVGAKPEAAGAPRSPLRRRWPLAAAATVLLSSLAVILASRTEQHMPTHTMQEEQAAMPSPHSPMDLSKDSAAVDRGPAEAAAASAPPPPQSDAAQKPRAAEQSPAPAAPPQAAPPAPVAPESAAPAPGPKLPETPLRAAKPSAAQTTSDATSSSPDAAGSDRALSTEQMARRVAPAPSAQGDDARHEATSKRAQRSAREWLELIVRLRTEGRHAEADAELKRFRESYPEREVPAAAQAAAGAR
jgi:hypothetical protein